MNSFKKLTVALSLALIMSATAFSSTSGELTVEGEHVTYSAKADDVDLSLGYGKMRTNPEDRVVIINLSGDEEGKVSTLNVSELEQLKNMIAGLRYTNKENVKILEIESLDGANRQVTEELAKELFKYYDNLEQIRVISGRSGVFYHRADFTTALEEDDDK